MTRIGIPGSVCGFAFVCAFTTFLSLPAVAGPAEDLANEAVRAYNDCDYARRADLSAEAIRTGGDDANLFYNAACSSSLAGRPDPAFESQEPSRN